MCGIIPVGKLLSSWFAGEKLAAIGIRSLFLCAIVIPVEGQQLPAACRSAQADSLAGSLCRSEGKEIHIFYIHGIGNDGPTDYDSLALRKSICEYLKDCTSPAGDSIGPWDYAAEGRFAPDAPVPQLDYMDQPVWRSAEEWRAAAPYAIHFQIARTSGPTLYVDELNWWPLTFALKCRQIIEGDASFVAPNKSRIETCSKLEPEPDVPGRFRSYDWITPDIAKDLLKMPARGARLNRDLKTSLMDWGFSDAVMALGPLRPYVLDGLRQLILKSLSDTHPAERVLAARPADNDEFVIVSHSLGSYLIFSALDTGEAAEKTQIVTDAGDRFDQVLARTSMVYFFANQLRLLELASLDGSTERNLATHLERWSKLRCEHLGGEPGSSRECPLPRITALNDPSDLLTWTVPDMPGIEVENWSVKNSIRWLGIFENPTLAHNNYARDKRAIREMLASHPPAKD